jgi:hypothetical protein
MSEITNPVVGGFQLAFAYEAVRAISNGIVRMIFSTSIDEFVSSKISGVVK